MDQIEKQFPHEISSLLDPPSPHHVQEYFDNLLRDRNCRGLKVKQNGDFGKGVYADVDFGQGELVLKDPILVGAQHSSNKLDCLVCDHCFQFIGTVEHQIGRKLYLQELDGGSGSSHHNHNGCDEDNHHHDGCDSSDDDDEEHNHHQQQHGGCGSSQSKQKIPLPEDVVQSLLNDELVLPRSKQFTLQSAISCPGGCHEAYYCSQSCAETDWENFHSLLCTGPKSQALCREALVKFIQHADETNDIFILAAKVISSTILKYKKMKLANVKETGKQNLNLSLLLEAWKPISMGYKRRWWDCMALPDEVDPSDEAAFRMQIKELAFTSLQLLKEAIFDIECEPLFSLEVYGHIIGMFELNNLDLVVASPVEDYFLYIDDLPYPEKERAMEITRPILDALGEDYSVCCQGTAFFSLQSCMNHSCRPNAKAFKREEDRDGQATIISTRPISQGEEVTISYIDEDLSYEERQALLADYGFRCHCSKCLEEQP